MKTLVAVALLLFTMPPAHAQTTSATGKQTTSLTGKWTGTFTRTAPDGRTQSIDFMFDLTQKGKVSPAPSAPTRNGSGRSRRAPSMVTRSRSECSSRTVR